MPAVAAGSTTAAAAPSPTRMQVVRSVQSVTEENFSEPTTRARVAEPVRMAWSARARAWLKPEQAVLMSRTAGCGMPSRAAVRPAMLGARFSAVQVATRTRSMSGEATPALAKAFSEAWAAMESTVSSSAMCRVRMPTRLRIQASSGSTSCSRSWLVRTRAGW
jgi:hypothetical protein